jgi:hypothetical protein
MKNVFLILLLTLFFIVISGENSIGQTSGFAKICFIDKNEDHSKTYLGKLTKGNLENLKYELQNNFSEPVVTFDDKSKSESEGYVDRVTAQKLKKRWKGNKQKAKNDLLGNYEVKDEESLKKIKEKQLKEKEKRESERTISKNNINASPQSGPRPNSYISKHFKIKGKRIRNGQTIRRHAGYTCLIVKYKIREGNYFNTYVNIVEDYLTEGSKYNLKYHGNGSNRKYYLEFVSASKR